MHLTVSRLTDEELSDNDFVPKVIRQHMADGMIVNYTHEIPPGMLELIRAHHAPAVWLNAKLDADCVYPDDYGAARTVTQHLLSLGHRKIAMVHMIAHFAWQRSFEESWSSQHYSVHDRALGYTEALSGAGLAPRITSHERFIDEHEHMLACRALLSCPDRPTAVIAYSEHEVASVVCAALSLGLSIPRDLSIVAFAPSPMWIASNLVTIAAIPTEEQGRRAVRMLLAKLASPDQTCKPQAVAYGLGDERQTLAPPALG
jgi:LacI family transcriptional regulator